MATNTETTKTELARIEAHAQYAHELYLDGRERDAGVICPDAHEDYFCSGSNLPGEIEGLSLAAENVGVAAHEVSAEAEAALLELRGLTTKVFVDSGAFSEIAFGPQGPFVKNPITPAEWDKRLALYQRLADGLGHQLYVVAPDQVAFQQETLERLSRYADTVRAVRLTRAHVIVPVQKGALTGAEFFAQAKAILGFEPIAGIPLKKDATSIDELRDFAREVKPREIHFLGLGPASPNYIEAVAAVQAVSPNTRIFSDSVAIRRLVGRTNGRGGGPRAITAACDRIRAATPNASSRTVKRESARAVFFAAAEARIAEERAAGWFDAELFSSWEESQGGAAVERAVA